MIKDLAIQQDVTAQLSLVQQSMLSDAQLEKILHATGLDAKADTPKARARAIDNLRQSTRVNVENIGERGQPGGTIYSISYQDTDRARSLKVVEILLNSFVQDTLGGKLVNSEMAQKFLVRQIQENEQRLREAEQRLAEFKKDNVGTMPGEEGDYFTRLQSEIDANAKAETALSVATSRRDELARQLRDGALSAAAAPAVVNPGYGPAGAQPGLSSDTQGQIAAAQAKLDDLLLQFTDKHPEVIALRGAIAELKARRDKELDALRRGDPDAVMSSRAGTSPVYQSIQRGVNEANVEIASLRGEIAQHQRKIASLRRLMNSVPEVEAEFARLNRDYQVTRAQYSALVERLEKARLGQDAEANSSVRFDVIDPPTASFQPIKPNRRLLVLHVFVAGVSLGAVLAFLLSAFRPVFSHGRELEEATGLPVYGVVSLTSLDQYNTAYRRDLLLCVACAAGLTVAAGTAFVLVPKVAQLLA